MSDEDLDYLIRMLSRMNGDDSIRIGLLDYKVNEISEIAQEAKSRRAELAEYP